MSLAAVGHLPIHPNANGEAMAKALEFFSLKKIKMKLAISANTVAVCMAMVLSL